MSIQRKSHKRRKKIKRRGGTSFVKPFMKRLFKTFKKHGDIPVFAFPKVFVETLEHTYRKKNK